MNIVIPVIIMSVLALLFGIAIALASKKFAVKVDERIPQVRECLSGANCGACGYPGCDGYAAAIVEKGAPVNSCVPGGAEAAKNIAKIMGVETTEAPEKKVATVICRGSTEKCAIRFDYQGEKTCRNVAMTAEGDKACRYACIGYGDCVAACKFGAIHVGEDRLVRVDADKCTGCGACAAVCPKNVIRVEPLYKVEIKCRALEKGKVVKDHCKAGCIGCGLCAKQCKFGAITMVNNLPVIDREKCVGCLQCAAKCPTGAMWGDFEQQKKAQINEELCVGCTLCAKQCQFGAIEGELKQKHHIDPEKCVGCGQCAQKCPRKAIELK